MAALERLMPPEHGQDEEIDWGAVESVWGTRFPADYMAFMARYGTGSINGDAGVFSPLPFQGRRWVDDSMKEETANARHIWKMEGGREALDVHPEHLLAWGVTAGADILCWLTTGNDPDRWPVVVCGRHTRSRFTAYPFGMAEFLCRLFEDRFEDFADGCPVSSIFWEKGTPNSFVHSKEAERRWLAGLDPDTGEPDPYADMFPRNRATGDREIDKERK
ncbi:SMI1/KNR4 family protein [Streptomyces sp. NPDC015139]|uniref:SMI1/KNR4 family protein n=1 Tax=Streptomyces sp. NPDC015139 TaxID=3364942 RepID=UPI0036FF816B